MTRNQNLDLSINQDRSLTPLIKKDDEKFKLLKMKQLRKITIPPHKSARDYDPNYFQSYQREFIIGKYFLYIMLKKIIMRNADKKKWLILQINYMRVYFPQSIL
jgi:hypothetical protein